MPALNFTLAVIAYYALHSLLAADGVKAKLYGLVPPRYYRLGYNLLATVLLAGLIYWYFSMEKTPLWSPNRVLPFPGALMAFAGISWVVRAMKRYNLDEFMGLEQLRTGQKPMHNKLIIRGLNGRVRHPLYFGTLLIVVGTLLIFPNDAMFSFTLISTIYLVLGSRLEEEKLVAQFGEAYRKYQREVPMLLPFRWKRIRGI
jgi:protein-S-isoprenylcysteine O-methyltransferase Ste14